MTTPSLTSGLAKIRIRFLDELKPRLEELTILRAQAEHADSAETSMTQIGFIAHKLAGTAATLGFPDLGQAAAELDDVVTFELGHRNSRSDVLHRADDLLAAMHSALQAESVSSA